MSVETKERLSYNESGDTMDQNFRRGIILEHYQNPRNKGLVEDDSYLLADMNNESCIDEVKVQVKIEDGILKDIHFDGEACAICTSSSSIMVETLTGKTVEQAIEILKNFSNMIDEKEYREDVLEQAIVYDDIYKQPNRKKCALLPWWGIEKILGELESYETNHSV